MSKTIDGVLPRFCFLASLLLLCFCASDSVFGQQFETVWKSRFDKGERGLVGVYDFWGRENISYHFDKEINSWVMRTFIPKDSYDAGVIKRADVPIGGAGFKLRTMPRGTNYAELSYRVRFADNFDFVRGGKLPGLYGGKGNSGGRIPDGTDGFSFRLMWGIQGRGCVYAYLPTSVNYGTPLFHGKLPFVRGRWQTVRQEIVLNRPGFSDGMVRMWIDGRYIGEAGGLLVRTIEDLKINGLFFEVFFGGGDPSWASSCDTHIDFADFVVRTVIRRQAL